MLDPMKETMKPQHTDAWIYIYQRSEIANGIPPISISKPKSRSIPGYD
jgi:hypothetical protein